MDFLQENVVLISAITLAIILLLIIILTGYVKAPTDKAFIISGLRKKAKIVIGRSSVKIPFLERKDELELSLVQVDIRTESAVPTKEFINVRVDGVANVKIRNEEGYLEKAAQNFLNKDKVYIAAIAQQVLEGNMREIIGTMELTQLVHNRDAFASNVQESTADELSKMGLEVINLTIQNFVDDNNVIENLGIDNVTKIQKEAAIARANSERDIKVAQSRADSEANQAAVISRTEIAERENALLIKQAELKSTADRERAISDASYSIAEQQQRKEIEIETVNAEIAKTEREAEKKLKEIEVRESALRADIEKQADADRYRAQQESDAILYQRQKEIEAKAYEIERQALADMKKAEAKAYEIVQEAKAEESRAKAILQVGEAEASVIELKAEAQNKLAASALQMRMIEQLPDIVAAAATPLAKTEKIVMFGEGNVEKMISDTVNSSFSVVNGLKEATGIDLTQVANNFLGTKAAIEATGVDIKPADTPIE